ncbi:unnamed protein product [Paramecium sonneborni]|uniref:Uncharacterized protein n=1 Tax=Paramecium sonneborni TaxID=65129 RepID=A0A8S1JTQ7_9CILI|nr:unnamed protein product [Paramecium sonneborni]
MEEQLGQLRLEQMMQELNNHANCKSWNTYCSVNSGNNGCETMKPMCSKQASANCLEGKFIVINSACIKKTCDTAAVSTIFDTDEKCSTYQQQYVVARKVGCQARAACTFYRSQLQCEYKCFWDQTNKTCVDLNCGNIEATSSFDSHNKCVTVDTTLACTVRATNGTAIAGCMFKWYCLYSKSQLLNIQNQKSMQFRWIR